MFAGGIGELFGSLGTISLLVLLVLFFFSVVSWGVILYKWKIFKPGDEEEADFLRAYDLHATDYRRLRGLAQDLPTSPSAAVFLGIVDRVYPMKDTFSSKSVVDPPWNGGVPRRPYLEKVVQFTMQNQLSYLESYLPFLATTGNITPFIGLLGTVLGIINAFQDIGLQGTASLAAVAPGVAEALVATAAGLFAAIPAVVGYNYYLTRIRKTVFRVEAFSIEFLNALTETVLENSEVEAVR